jgi:hypothetical protein
VRLVTGQAHGMAAAHSEASSSPVNTASTPGSSLAAPVSMPAMLAWATGLRANASHSIPGRAMSSV